MTSQPTAPTGATSPAPVGLPLITLRVVGTPAAQGSTKAFAVRNRGGYTGRVAVTHANGAKITSWRQAILDEVNRAGLLIDSHGRREPLTGPVEVTIAFWLARPKGHYGTGRNAAQVKPSAPKRPAGTPDLDKLERAVLDALSAAGVWRDDAQVVQMSSGKWYTHGGNPPGALITIGLEDG